MGIWVWSTVIPVIAVVALSVWAMRRQDRMFPKGTPVPRDERDAKRPDWTSFWHRGGSGGL